MFGHRWQVEKVVLRQRVLMQHSLQESRAVRLKQRTTTKNNNHIMISTGPRPKKYKHEYYALAQTFISGY